jgi:hypothetical protein
MVHKLPLFRSLVDWRIRVGAQVHRPLYVQIQSTNSLKPLGEEKEVPPPAPSPKNCNGNVNMKTNSNVIELK